VSDDSNQTVQLGILQTSAQVTRDWAVQEPLFIPSGGQTVSGTTSQESLNPAAQEVFNLAENALDSSVRNEWTKPVLQSLDNKLGAFEQALNAFAWPTTSSSWSGARLVTGPESAKGKVSGTVVAGPEDQTARSTQMSGTDANGTAALAQYQVTGLQMSQPTTFSSTAVDPGAATTLSLGRHNLAISEGDGVQPASYISTAYDPTQTTTLSAGTYTFTSSYAGETRTHSVTIGSTWTWGDVLRAVGAEVNAQPTWVDTTDPTSVAPSTTYAQPGVSAQVTPWSIPSSTGQDSYTAGQSLQITGAAGQSFTLADKSGGLLAALGLTTRLTGSTVSFNVNAGDTWQNVFASMAGAVNGSQSAVTARTEAATIPSKAVPGQDLQLQGAYLSLTQDAGNIGAQVSLTDGGSGTLGSLMLTGRKQPGHEAEMVVNGQTQYSQTDTFSEDNGLVLLNLESTFPQSIPLSVTDGMDKAQQSWSDVVDAWNNLTKFLNNNSDLLDPSIGENLEAPVKGQAGNLRWLGVSSVGQKGQLWTNLDTFWRSATADPGLAQSTLTGSPAGLIPAWQSAVAHVRQSGLESWLKPATSFDIYQPSLTSEFQLEQTNRLINLLG